MNWQDEFSSTLVMNCFIRGKASPCNFHHPHCHFYVAVHGDDFTTIGPKTELVGFRQFLDKTRDCKHHWLGPDSEEETSVRILNRVICWNKDGISYEVDRRHAEVVIEQLQLKEAKGFTSQSSILELMKVSQERWPLHKQVGIACLLIDSILSLWIVLTYNMPPRRRASTWLTRICMISNCWRG